VLGIAPSATADEIRKAYHERMQEYHPDKVAHLGQELQELALEKSQQIQHAYRQLSE
jgi:DnaJ-class molecular chaperone